MYDKTSHAANTGRGYVCSAAVNQLGFGSAIAPDATSGISCDRVAKSDLINSCTVRSPAAAAAQFFCRM